MSVQPRAFVIIGAAADAAQLTAETPVMNLVAPEPHLLRGALRRVEAKAHDTAEDRTGDEAAHVMLASTVSPCAQ